MIPSWELVSIPDRDYKVLRPFSIKSQISHSQFQSLIGIIRYCDELSKLYKFSSRRICFNP